MDVIIAGAIVGAITVVVIAGPAGLLAGPLLVSAGYAAIGAVLGSALAFGAMALIPGTLGDGPGEGDGTPKGDNSGKVILTVERQKDSLSLKLTRSGKTLAKDEHLKRTFFSSDSLGSSIDKMLRRAKLDSETVVHLEFAGVGPAHKDLVPLELRNQGMRVSRDMEPEE